MAQKYLQMYLHLSYFKDIRRFKPKIFMYKIYLSYHQMFFYHQNEPIEFILLLT